MEPTRMLIRNPEVVEADVDGQRVLLSPKDFSYFGLEGTGAALWDHLLAPTTLDGLVDAMAAQYDVERASLSDEITDFASALDAAGLLTSAE